MGPNSRALREVVQIILDHYINHEDFCHLEADLAVQSNSRQWVAMRVEISTAGLIPRGIPAFEVMNLQCNSSIDGFIPTTSFSSLYVEYL